MKLCDVKRGITGMRHVGMPIVVVLAIFVVGGVVVWLIDCSMVSLWVGVTKLNVEFHVGADDGQPIANANIEILSGSVMVPIERIQTDARGIAVRHIPNHTCAGRESRLCFTNVRVVPVPSWQVRAFANGYVRKTDWIYLPEDYSRDMIIGEPGQDRLVVHVVLEKALSKKP
jgi:hypothetical protein